MNLSHDALALRWKFGKLTQSLEGSCSNFIVFCAWQQHYWVQDVFDRGVIDFLYYFVFSFLSNLFAFVVAIYKQAFVNQFMSYDVWNRRCTFFLNTVVRAKTTIYQCLDHILQASNLFVINQENVIFYCMASGVLVFEVIAYWKRQNYIYQTHTFISHVLIYPYYCLFPYSFTILR